MLACQIGVSGFALWILIFADIKKQVASNKTQPVFYFVLLLET